MDADANRVMDRSLPRHCPRVGRVRSNEHEEENEDGNMHGGLETAAPWLF